MRRAAGLLSVVLLVALVLNIPVAARLQMAMSPPVPGGEATAATGSWPAALAGLYRELWLTGGWRPVLTTTLAAWGTSLRILLPGLALGLLAGTLLGLVGALARRLREPLVAVSMVLFAWSDFSLILTLQTAVVAIGRWAGQPVFKVGPEAVLLPVLLVAIFPMALSARAAAEAVERVRREMFMRTALAKGFSPARALIRHGLPHVVGQMLADMPTLATISLSNLVMVEFIFATPGLTRIIFNAVRWDQITIRYVPAGVALALTWFVLDTLVRWLRLRIQPYLSRDATGGV